jgi:hypothetical protein
MTVDLVTKKQGSMSVRRSHRWTRIAISIIYLRFDQDKIDEQDNIIMFDVFVGEALAIGTLCQSYPFS